MNASTKYITIALAVAALFLMLLPAFNIYTDSSRVLTRGLDTAYKGRAPNIAFLRMAHLLEGEEHYDGIVFGSSRTRFGVDADYVGSLFGGKWYKAEYLGGTQREHLHNLKLLIAHKRAPEHIIVMLDDFVVFRHILTQSDYFYRLYPTSVIDWLDFYRFYLFKRPSETDWKIAFGRTPLEPYKRILNERRGAVFFEDGGRDPDPDVISLRYFPEFVLSAPPFGSGNEDKPHRIASVLVELQELRKLCEDNQIKMTLVITPRHYKTLFAKNVNLLMEFRVRLASIMPYFDASPLSETTMENRKWNESSHFMAALGNQVFDEVAKVEVKGKPSSAYVTADSVQVHVESMRLGLRQNLVALLRKDPRMRLHPSYLRPESSVRYDVMEGKTVDIDQPSRAQGNTQVMKVSLTSAKDINLKILANVTDNGGLAQQLTIYDFALRGGKQDVWVALPDAAQGQLKQIAFDTDGAKVLINHIELFDLAELQTN